MPSLPAPGDDPAHAKGGFLRSFRVLAPAKVNLTLHVLGRRPDGFHDLASLFVPISLADRLLVRVGGRRVRVRVPGRPELEGDDNLCAKAARAFAEATGLAAGVDVLLEKRIPVAAGLGGGSTDAAAVLRCLARAHGLRSGDPRVAGAALAVGSDVPFFLRCVPAVARGRGERLEPAPALPPLHLLIVKPPFGVSAAAAYGELARLRAAGALPPGADPGLPGSLRTCAAVARALANDLEAPVTRLHPEIADIRRRIEETGAAGVRMSGSGSCVFGLFRDAAAARRAVRALPLRPKEEALLARALRRGPGVRDTANRTETDNQTPAARRTRGRPGR